MSSERAGDKVLRIILVVIGVILLLPLLMAVFAMPMVGMMGWTDGGGMMNGGMAVWGFTMLVLWLVVLLLIGYVLYRTLGGPRSSTSRTDPAMEELRLAYARGDLTEEEFETRRRRLRDEDFEP